MTMRIRKSGDRGYFNYGWLKTFHTFSFGDYRDSDEMGFRALRVINENRVRPSNGFPLHTHQNMEIVSIIIEGALSHQDELGNRSIQRKDHVHLMSAGKGLTHCELNASDKEKVYFLQMWILPSIKNVEPHQQEKYIFPSNQINQLCLIISPDGRDGSLKINQDTNIYLTDLELDQELNYQIADQRHVWIQLISGQLKLNEMLLETGDGIAISDMADLHLIAQTPSKFVLIDLA